jgi:hypothetical protein
MMEERTSFPRSFGRGYKFILLGGVGFFLAHTGLRNDIEDILGGPSIEKITD